MKKLILAMGLTAIINLAGPLTLKAAAFGDRGGRGVRREYRNHDYREDRREYRRDEWRENRYYAPRPYVYYPPAPVYYPHCRHW